MTDYQDKRNSQRASLIAQFVQELMDIRSATPDSAPSLKAIPILAEQAVGQGVRPSELGDWVKSELKHRFGICCSPEEIAEIRAARRPKGERLTVEELTPSQKLAYHYRKELPLRPPVDPWEGIHARDRLAIANLINLFKAKHPGLHDFRLPPPPEEVRTGHNGIRMGWVQEQIDKALKNLHHSDP